MALRRHGHDGRRRRLQRHLPDRLGQAGRLHRATTARIALPVRRERGAARQVRSRCASAARSSRKVVRLRHGGPGATSATRMVMPLDELLALGREPRRGASRTSGRSGSRPPPGRAGAPGLHLRHHRPAQGRDAQPPQRHLPAAATPTPSSRSASDDEQLALPAALPHRRAHLHRSSCRCAPAPSPTSPRASRRCRRTCARWRRPLFFAVPRIWERFYSGIAIRMKEATWIGRLAYALGDRHRPARSPSAELDGRKPSPLAEAASHASPTGWCWTTSSARSACTASASPAPAPRRSRPT